MKCLRKPPAARAKCLRALPAHRPTRDVESTMGEQGLAAHWTLMRPDVAWFNDLGPYGGGANTAATWVPKVDADDRPFGDRRRAEALLAQVNAGFGGDLLKALTQYPLVATDTGHLLDGWHRLYLWVKSGLPGGPPTLVMVPGRGGLGAAPGNGKLVYRGITQDEHDFIVTHRYIQSNERYCIRGEGTCFATSYDDAEGYVNYGRTNPIATKSPTYVLAVSSGGDVVVDPRDGYPKVAGHVASDRIKVAYRFNPDGTMERGVWSPTGFSSRSKPKPHPWRKSPAQWGARPGLGRVSDLCTGKDLGRQVWDYTCVLSPAQRKEGYTLRVEIGPSGNYIRTSLHHPDAPHDKQLRQGEVGFVSGVKSGKTLVVGESFITRSFRGRGLGMRLYEALYSRAQAMGAKAVAGTAHSTPASMLHRKMAEKHELKYQPVPNYGAQTDNWETRKEWETAPSGAYDEKWRPYQFPLNGAPAPDRAEAQNPREQAYVDLVGAVRHVWKNAEFVLPVVTMLSDEPTAHPDGFQPFASIQFNPQGVWASGNSLLRRAPQYTLRVSDRFLALPAEQQQKVLIHEAVHLGYPKHDKGFRDLCREKGGTVSERALDDPGIKAEKKVGSRYQVQRVFTDEREAKRWAQEQQRAEPGSRWRLSLGGVGAEPEGLDGLGAAKPACPSWDFDPSVRSSIWIRPDGCAIDAGGDHRAWAREYLKTDDGYAAMLKLLDQGWLRFHVADSQLNTHMTKVPTPAQVRTLDRYARYPGVTIGMTDVEYGGQMRYLPNTDGRITAGRIAAFAKKYLA